MRGTLGEGREIVHARAVASLADRHAEGPGARAEVELAPPGVDRDELYERILFHGPALQAIERVDGCDDRGIAGFVSTAPEPSSWLARPLRRQWLTDPLAIDAAFQLMILWCRERAGAPSLPTAVGSYRQFRRRFPDDGVRVVAAIRKSTDLKTVADLDFLDARGDLVARIESYECAVNASLEQAFRRNRLGPREAVANRR
jgi:hypothetical protein